MYCHYLKTQIYISLDTQRVYALELNDTGGGDIDTFLIDSQNGSLTRRGSNYISITRTISDKDTKDITNTQLYKFSDSDNFIASGVVIKKGKRYEAMYGLVNNNVPVPDLDVIPNGIY